MISELGVCTIFPDSGSSCTGQGVGTEEEWLKLFGLDPGMNDPNTINMYIACTTAAATQALTLQMHGYDNINIHSAKPKSEYASNSGLNQNYVSSTDILWSI